MKKYLMLGVNSNNNKCCELKCLLPFSALIPKELEASDFIHNATNWGGCDDISRTLDIHRMKPTGSKYVLVDPIRFHGCDYDCGMSTSWCFKVDEIWEIEEE